MKINNLSKTPKEWIVARWIEDDFWYWGSWEDWKKAIDVSNKINGIVLNRKDITNA